MDKKIKKQLDKLLEEEGVSGYSVDGQKIIIYVEDAAVMTRLLIPVLKGYTIEMKPVGRFEAL